MATVATTTRRTAFVVDSQPLWLEALERVLVSTGVEVVGTASTLDEALLLIDKAQPHLLIGELSGSATPEEGSGWLRAVRERHPELKTIVVSSRQEPEDVEAAFAAGAAAYVFKTAEAGDVALAIRQTYESSVFFARSDYLSRNGAARVNGNGHSHDLTQREVEILSCRRGSHQPRHRKDAVGDRADGQVPPLEHLPEAPRLKSDRGESLGANERPPAGKDRRLTSPG